MNEFGSVADKSASERLGMVRKLRGLSEWS